MKKRLLVCALCFLFCITGMTLPALAAEGDPVPAAPTSEAGISEIIDILTTIAPLIQNLSDDSDTQLPILQDIQSGSGVVPVTNDLLAPPDRVEGSLAATMEEIFGAYTPLTYQVDTYTDTGIVTTTEVVPGLAGLDWPFLGGVFLFSIMLSGLFKLLGVVLR